MTQFSTEEGWDFVTLSSCTDVTCETKQQLMEHSGSLPDPRSYTSPSGFLLVEFASNTNIPDEGFTAAWNSDVSTTFVCPCDCEKSKAAVVVVLDFYWT
jgi:hypothetical protein